MVLAGSLVGLEEGRVHGDGEVRAGHREGQVLQGLHVSAVLIGLAEAVVTLNIFVLLLELFLHVIEHLNGHADVGVSSLERSIELCVVVGHEASVAVHAVGDVASPAIRSDSHVEPLSLLGVVSTVGTQDELRGDGVVRSHVEGVLVGRNLIESDGSGKEAIRRVGHGFSSETEDTVGGVGVLVEDLLPVLGFDLVDVVEELVFEAEARLVRSGAEAEVVVGRVRLHSHASGGRNVVGARALSVGRGVDGLVEGSRGARSRAEALLVVDVGEWISSADQEGTGVHGLSGGLVGPSHHLDGVHVAVNEVHLGSKRSCRLRIELVDLAVFHAGMTFVHIEGDRLTGGKCCHSDANE